MNGSTGDGAARDAAASLKWSILRLQFAYFTRRPRSVIAVDSVPEMLEKARANFEIAARENPWFDPSFITLAEGDALDLPVPDGSADLAAQNCLFNIFVTPSTYHYSGGGCC